VERTETGWGKPKPFNSLINTPESFAGCPTIANNGNLYFFSDRAEGIGGQDIWMSRFLNGAYEKPQNLGDSVNTEDFDFDPFIAPDETYIIFTRIDKKRKGDADLFISFRRSDNTWTKATNMGDKINSKGWEFCPTVSPDGKYIFFTSRRKSGKGFSEIPITYEEKIKILNSPGNGNTDIYWVDAKIIEELKPKHLK
jgi:Tol biopolymer transport system component